MSKTLESLTFEELTAHLTEMHARRLEQSDANSAMIDVLSTAVIWGRANPPQRHPRLRDRIKEIVHEAVQHVHRRRKFAIPHARVRDGGGS